MNRLLLLLALVTALVVACVAQSPPPRVIAVTIASGATTPTVGASMAGCTLTGFIIPAGWTGGTSMTFQGAPDGTNYYLMTESEFSATSLTVTLTANRYIPSSSPAAFWGVRSIKPVVSTTSRAETFYLVCR